MLKRAKEKWLLPLVVAIIPKVVLGFVMLTGFSAIISRIVTPKLSVLEHLLLLIKEPYVATLGCILGIFLWLLDEIWS